MNARKENYDLYVELYKQKCIENDKLIPYNKLKSFGLPDARFFIKNSNHRNINNFIEFQRYCGFIPNKNITKEECDLGIKFMIGKYGENISYDNFREPKLNEIAVAILNKYYGSLNKMKESFSLKINKESTVDKHKSKDEMLNDLKTLYKELGRTPTSKEINKCEYCLNSQTYTKEFGSLYNSFIEIGITPRKKTISVKLSDDEIKDIYVSFINSIGFIPSFDYCCGLNLPSPTTVIRRFNMSWIDFLKHIGFNPTNKQYGDKYIANDGTLCLSWFEQDIHNLLLRIGFNNINKETLYRNFVSDNIKEECGLLRCDWEISHNNKIYILEYFGMMADKKYVNKVNRKLDIINKDINKNYEFIPIYQNDFKLNTIHKKMIQIYNDQDIMDDIGKFFSEDGIVKQEKKETKF